MDARGTAERVRGTAGEVERTTWHGEPARVARGGHGLRAVVVPGRGGKLVSLTDGAGREWLAQPAAALPPPARPGGRFVDGDMCGWDECVPTVDACVVKGPSGGATALPGHGEAWTTPWEEHDDGSWGFDGALLPYRLTRRIEPTTTGLRLAYRAEATSDGVVPLMWVAHPQLTAAPGSRMVLPDEVTHIEGKFGVQGRQPWNEALADVDRYADGTAAKFWVDRRERASWAGLERPDGSLLRMSWDPALVPYLALWVDVGMFSRERVVALEPSTGSREELGEAIAEGGCSWLRPSEPITWWLDVEVHPDPEAHPRQQGAG